MTIIQTPFQTENSRQMILRGYELHQDDRKGKLIPVILSHGFSADLSHMMPYGRYLAEHGYRAFVYDFCGGGYHTVSDGSFHEDMTPLTEVDDLLAVIHYVQHRDDTDSEKLILMGNSMGGFVSALAAARMKESIKALILFYPAFCIPDDARNGHVQDLVFDPHHIPAHIGHGEKMVSGKFAESVMKMDIWQEISPYRGPVLIVHGDRDEMVSPSYSRKAEQVYADCELHYLSGAPHGFKEEYFTKACTYLLPFLQKNGLA